MKYISYSILIVLLLCSKLTRGQVFIDSTLTKRFSFEEFLGYVKKHHPMMKQANIRLSMGEANLLKARGGFDPKVEVDYDRKKFKKTTYYNELNAAFKIPTWYGVEFKANFEENRGAFLDPSLTVPEDGLYSAGVSFSLAQGFLINERMATLKKARFFKQQTIAERDLLINDLIFKASKTYFEWLEATNEEQIYSAFLANASQRFDAVKKSVIAGDKAAIDSVEAKIALQNRTLSLEAARLKRRKKALAVSNYLWIQDIPMELKEEVLPQAPDIAVLESSLRLEGILNAGVDVTAHPKIRALDQKLKGLEVDRFLKMNKLLPKLDLQYNFLNTEYEQLNTFNTANYKAFLTFKMPIFLRKERGDLKLAKLKIKDTRFKRLSESLALQNKIEGVQTEIRSLKTQNDLIYDVVENYEILVTAEERKFSLGESSLFLINSREKKLIDTKLKKNALLIKGLVANAKLFHVTGQTIENLY